MIKIQGHRLIGSTMIETIVAMVIILISSGAGLVHFSGMFRDVNDELRTTAELKIQILAAETKGGKDFNGISIDTAGIKLLRTVDDYPFQPNLKILKIEAFSLSGKRLCDYRELINPLQK